MTGIGSPGLSLVGPRWMMPTPRLYLPMSTTRSWRSGGDGGAFFSTKSMSAFGMSKAMFGGAWFCANAVCDGATVHSATTPMMNRFMSCLLATDSRTLFGIRDLGFAFMQLRQEIHGGRKDRTREGRGPTNPESRIPNPESRTPYLIS